MGEPLSSAQESCDLIRRCLAGEAAAVEEFQRQYGELIYGYPVRVYRIPADRAGDFYVFAFDGGRIFRRLRTFEGRAPLRAYLLGFVLDDLVLEWKRSEREIETVSIEAWTELPEAAVPPPDHGELSPPEGEPTPLVRVLDSVAPEKAVVMKLLHVEDCEITAADVRYLAKASGRRLREIVAGVEHLRGLVREREAALKRVEDTLDAVHAWIQLYERRMYRIADDLRCLPPTSTAAERLRAEQGQIEHKLVRRQQQRIKVLAQAQRRKVTAPYKEIAALMNTSIGNIASQIARLRQELRDRGIHADSFS